MFNIAILTGRLTATPELKKTPNSISVTSFSIAVQRPYKSGEETQSDFINVVAWRQTADFVCKHFTKGSMIGVEGSIQTRKYTDKNGNNRTSFEVMANNVQFVDSKSKDNLKEFATEHPEFTGNNDFADLGEASENDLPF